MGQFQVEIIALVLIWKVLGANSEFVLIFLVLLFKTVNQSCNQIFLEYKI